MFVYVLAYKMSCIRDPTWILQYKVYFDPRILKNHKNVEKMDPALFKSADLWKRKQTPQRLLVSKNWNTYKTKNLVFDLIYISWKFQPCRSNHYWVREFSNFCKNTLKMAILGTEIIRSALAWEPDHIERWLMALWDPLMTLRLGQHDFQIPWKCLWNGFFNNKKSVILKVETNSRVTLTWWEIIIETLFKLLLAAAVLFLL